MHAQHIGGVECEAEAAVFFGHVMRHARPLHGVMHAKGGKPLCLGKAAQIGKQDLGAAVHGFGTLPGKTCLVEIFEKHGGTRVADLIVPPIARTGDKALGGTLQVARDSRVGIEVHTVANVDSLARAGMHSVGMFLADLGGQIPELAVRVVHAPLARAPIAALSIVLVLLATDEMLALQLIKGRVAILTGELAPVLPPSAVPIPSRTPPGGWERRSRWIPQP